MICQECGMPCEPAEYHPFAACLMFKACHDSSVVRENLNAVRNDVIKEQAESTGSTGEPTL